MTREQYDVFCQAYDNFMERNGFDLLSTDTDSGFFSWHPCECCGSKMGGTRYWATGVNLKRKLREVYRICSNCVYYNEYGRLDDLTTMFVEG